jgi:hypothetical protein
VKALNCNINIVLIPYFFSYTIPYGATVLTYGRNSVGQRDKPDNHASIKQKTFKNYKKRA